MKSSISEFELSVLRGPGWKDAKRSKASGGALRDIWSPSPTLLGAATPGLASTPTRVCKR